MSTRSSSLLWLMLICCAFSVCSIVLVELTGESKLFSIGVIPIVLSGWLFSWRAVLLTFAFLYLTSLIYMTQFYAGIFPASDTAMGLAVYTFFALIGVFIAKVRRMSDRIERLNSELTEKNRELEDLSLRDHLTNLHNRRYVNEIVLELANNFLNRLTIPEARMRDTEIADKVIAILMIDIDKFKAINDTYGHAAGDRVLVEVSDRLERSVRFDDVVARWGGEEFLVVCPGTRREYVGLIIEKVLGGIRAGEYALEEGVSIEVTVSIGCSYYPLLDERPDALSFEQVINICDAALFHSKESGRNRASYVVPLKGDLDSYLERGAAAYQSLIRDESLFSIETYV